jgi:hypothetical protein
VEREITMHVDICQHLSANKYPAIEVEYGWISSIAPGQDSILVWVGRFTLSQWEFSLEKMTARQSICRGTLW